MIKLIIFDYDGVIVDSFPKIHEVHMKLCEKIGKSCPKDITEFRKIYGNCSTEYYNNMGFSKEERKKGNLIFREEILKKNPKPFEGILDVLKELNKDYTLVLISSSHIEEVKQKLERFGLLEIFDDIIAKEDQEDRFVKTESIRKVISDMKVDPAEILMIGDRNVDFIEGTEAGLSNIILVEYGWGYNAEDIPEYKQKTLVNTPKDILIAIKEF